MQLRKRMRRKLDRPARAMALPKGLGEARAVIETCRRDYNEVRTHSSLDYQPPCVFARKIA